MNIRLSPLALLALALGLAACGDDSATQDPCTRSHESFLARQARAEKAGGATRYVPVFDHVRINSHPDQENFQKAEASIDLGSGPFSKVELLVHLDSSCFPFSKWQKDPPPAGENWPPKCDAFDRNFEFVLDPAEGEGDPPGFELVRAITPFGGPMDFTVDITDLANARPGKHDLISTISTWSDGAGQVSGSDGGWTVTAQINVTPGPAPREVLAVVPIFNGSQPNQSGGPAPIPFEVPACATSGRIEYRVTGHGGGDGGAACIGPAEEFCSRTHTIYLDGEVIDSYVPWRDNCSDLCTQTTGPGPSGTPFTYCAENPCGAIASVNAPRANWCPGSVTPPKTWSVEAMSVPGEHTFTWDIDEVAQGGTWRISAVYYAYRD